MTMKIGNSFDRSNCRCSNDGNFSVTRCQASRQASRQAKQEENEIFQSSREKEIKNRLLSYLIEQRLHWRTTKTRSSTID